MCHRGEDIVTRLRNFFFDHDEDCSAWVSGASTDVDESKCDCSRKLIADAADEIERLRANSWGALANTQDQHFGDASVKENET